MRSLPARFRDATFAVGVLVLLAASTACGGKGGPAGPDLSTPEATFDLAMEALSAGDLARLDVALSPAGAQQVRRDLEAWRKVLVDPTTGPRALARLPAPRDEADKGVLGRALKGDPAALLSVYVRADPRPAAKAKKAERPPDAAWAQLDYAARDGSLRRVVLTRSGAVWKIDHLQL